MCAQTHLFQAPTSPRHLRSPRGRPYLHSFGELQLGRDGILKAVHRASTLPGSLSAVRSNPSSSSLFYSVSIILHAKAGSVNSRFSKFRKTAGSVKQSIFANGTFNILFIEKASFFPAIPHFIADFNGSIYFLTKSLPQPCYNGRQTLCGSFCDNGRRKDRGIRQ